MFVKLEFSLIVLTTIFITIFSKISSPQNGSYLDSLDKRFALQFQITDNFSLTDFQGTIFSGKYHFAKREAVRIGLSVSFGDSETETELTRLDTAETDKSKQESKLFSITLSTQYQRYLSVADNISFFGGIGPFVTIFDRTMESIINEEGTDAKRKSQRKGFSTGADIILGTEWWFYKYISLSAEYGMKIIYSSATDELMDDTIKGKSTLTSFGIFGNQVSFGITVYF
jgi:hypothetical protein